MSRFRRDESGAFTMFGLYMFLLMVIIGGMAVDLMRFETKRVKLQGTLDAATLAATNLQQSLDPELLIKDYMVKRGYDPNLVLVNDDSTYVGRDEAAGIEGKLVARGVTASYDLDVNTFFMHMVNIPTLSTATGSGAFERIQNVEIALVVDISGSMGGQKIIDLKESAKTFFNAVIDEERTEGITSVSVIPYNHAVVVPDSLLDRLNTSGMVAIPAAAQAPYPGALTSYPRTADGSEDALVNSGQVTTTESKCVRFYDDQLTTDDLAIDYSDIRAIRPPAIAPDGTVIDAGTVLDRMAYYDPDGKSAGAGGSWDRPADDSNRRCDPTRGAILPFETSISALETHIDSLYADGWTAIDNGMKWAVALLDPAMRPVVNNMVDAGLLAEKVRDRPGDYSPEDTMKVIVLMTDGANTTQYDLESSKKTGPSRIWFSEQASREWGPNGEDWRNVHVVDSNEDGSKDRNKSWFDGFYVEMPANDTDERFMRQHRIGTWNDNEFDAVLYGVSEVPDDMVQLTYTQLYDRFSERAVAEFFRDEDVGDWSALNDHWNAERTVENRTSADRRLSGDTWGGSTEYGICDVAKYIPTGQDEPDILVFSIAFDAGTHAENVLRDCATDTSFFYDADNGTQLREAFAAIAGAITKLRLTQ